MEGGGGEIECKEMERKMRRWKKGLSGESIEEEVFKNKCNILLFYFIFINESSLPETLLWGKIFIVLLFLSCVAPDAYFGFLSSD